MTTGMQATSHVATLLLFCRASAWPVVWTRWHGDGDSDGSPKRDDGYGYGNRSGKGTFSVREIYVAVELQD